MEKSRIFLLLLFLWGGVLGCGGGKAEGDDFDKGEIQEDASDAISDATEDVAFDQGKDSSEKKPIADNWVQSFIGNCIMEDHWLSFYDGGKAVHTVLDLNACQEHGVYINEGEYSVDEAGDLNFTIHYGNDSTISRKWTYSVMDNLEIPYLSYPLLFSGKSLNWKSYAKGKEPFSWRRIQEDISAKQGADGYSSIRKLDLKVKLDKAPVPGSDCKMTLQWDAFLSYNDETEKTDTGSTELSCSIKESSSPGVISIKWKDFDYWTEVLKGMGFYNKCSHGMCALVEEAFQSEFLYLKDNPDILFHNGYNAWYAGVKNEPPEALPVCGNAVCEYGEYEWDCQKDCCTPDCNDKQCGDNGCNGSCGSCEAGCSCINGLCAGSCKPACGNGVCDQWENAQTCQQDCKYSVEMFIKGIECETADWNPQITEFIVFLEWITSVPAKCHLLFGLKTLENAGEMWIEEDFSISHKYDLALSYFYFYDITEGDKILFQMKCWDQEDNIALSDIKTITMDKSIIKCVNPFNEKCSDGGFVMCRIMPPVCGDGKVLAAVNGCYKCLFEKTCTCNDGSDPVCPSPVPNCPEGTELAVQNQCHVCASPWTCEPVE